MPESAERLRAAGVSELLAPLLARRGVEDPEDVEHFLRPTLDHLHPANLLAGMDEAVDRLVRAREAGERVAIVGDYDVDGVTGTALLVAVFGATGIDCLPILPHRMTDGYGFQVRHVDLAQARDCRVIVTVDCGTTSREAVEVARSRGLDVVVTDHHLPGELPDGVLQINPKQPHCRYPFPELSGAGLAFKLATAVAEACDRSIDPRLLVRIACLGTVADLVPLKGENRVIAAVGLAELARSRSVGLRALMSTAKLRPPLKASDIGYRLGPRLNAPGRLDTAEKSLELLLCRDPRRARAIAEELDGWNRDRQEAERRVVREARERFETRATEGDLPSILVAWDPSWHRGVVGIAAGRIARSLNRPTILFGISEGEATGSGRSIRGVDLHGFLSRWTDRLPRFGGHSQAIGLTVAPDALENLRSEWEEAAGGEWSEIVRRRKYEYELDLTAPEVDRRLLADLDSLEPHGQDNPRPMARIRGPLRLLGEPRVFGKGHLDAVLRDRGEGRIRILGWGWSDRLERLRTDCEVLGHLEMDSWSSSPTLRLVDVRSCS